MNTECLTLGTPVPRMVRSGEATAWGEVVNWESRVYVVFTIAKKIKYILYDDMCHLGPFSQNPAVLQMNPITRFFGNRHLAVDCLHFLNHKDKVKK